MSCPEKFRGESLEIKKTVKNREFFTNQTIDNWTFMNFLSTKEQNAIKRIKTTLQEYRNSIASLISKHRKQIDPDLLGYLTELKTRTFTDEQLREISVQQKNGDKENISITNSTISNSNIVAGNGSGTINVNKGKRKLQDDNDIITVKKNKDSFALLKPVTPNISYRFNTPDFSQGIKTSVESIAYIKLHDQDVCQSQAINDEYAKNMIDSDSIKHLNSMPIAKDFLLQALNQKLNALIPRLAQNGFDDDGEYDQDTTNAILLLRLILTDFFVNCRKPAPKNALNERTPFVEYAVPIFKCYSAVYNDVCFQWCEKGLETNKCISYYNTETKAKRRLADGVGYLVHDNSENILLESSGEENDAHTEEVTIKLLECTIRALKLEMDQVKHAALETFLKRKFLTYTYAGDKLTMLSTSLVSKEKWGYTLVREAVIPRTWSARFKWTKVMDMIFCTKAMLDEQKEIGQRLQREHNGFTVVAPGLSINDLCRL